MKFNEILLEIDQGLATLTLNRPDIREVDGVVKTIFLSFLDAVPGEERVAEG